MTDLLTGFVRILVQNIQYNICHDCDCPTRRLFAHEQKLKWIKHDTHSYLMCFHSFVLSNSLGNSLLSVSHFTGVFVGEEITSCSVIVPDFNVNILGQLSILSFPC